MAYSKIKSKFIKAELKKTSWKKRDYINDLKDIERYALGETFGLNTGYIINRLERDYPKQWKIIWQEVDPKGYKYMVKSEKKEKELERKENERFDNQEKRELKKEHASWKKMGGRI